MMTSLSRQLDRLKTPQSSAHKERKGKVSFLYDFGDAKQFDNDTHYAIALNGLEELISRDPSIARFSDTLFSESSKTLDRGVQSIETNNDLDTEIESYLFSVVSNYFLLTHSHKTIEWLIQRYQINEYNVDALIASVMPFHETLLFTRLIQTCASPKISTNKWFWLKTLQVSGSPLHKSILITRCISDTGFLHFICDNAFKSLKINKKDNRYIGFFVSTLINIIDKNTSENVISIIINYVVKSLKSRYECLRMASYSVVAHMCCCATLQSEVLSRIFKAMSKRSSSSNSLLMALASISSNQQLDCLPKSLLNIIEVKHLNQISNFNIESLVCVVFKSLIYNLNETDMKGKLRKLLNELPLSKLSIITCIESIAINIKEDNAKIESAIYIETLSLIERRFPTLFDESLLELDCISLIAPLLGAFKYTMIKDADVSVPLIAGLKHYNESVRNATIQHIIDNFDDLLLQSDESTLQQIKNVFIDTFHSSTSQIVISMLGIKEKMFQIFTEKEMYEICGYLLKCCDSNQTHSHNETSIYWYQLKNSVLATICCLPSTDKNGFFSLIYSYLFPICDMDLNTVAIILESKSANYHEFLKHLRKKCQKLFDNSNEEKDLDKIVSKICNEFAIYYINNSDINIEKCFTYFNAGLRKTIFNLLIVERIIVRSSDLSVKERIGNVLIEALKRMNVNGFSKTSKSKCKLYNDFVTICINCVKTDQIHISMIEYVFNSIIDSIDSTFKSYGQNDVWYWHKQFYDNNFYSNLFKFLFDNSFNKHKKIFPVFQNLLLKYVKKLGVTIGIDFFSPFWSLDENCLYQLRSLAIILNLSGDYFNYTKVTKLSLLIPLMSPSNIVREMAVKVIKRINDVNNDPILKYVLKSTKQIENDENKICLIIAKIFDRTSSSSKHIKQNDFEILKNDFIESTCNNEASDKIKLNFLLLLSKANLQSISDLFAIDWFSDINSINKIKSKFIETLISFYNNNDVWSSIVSNNSVFLKFFIKALNNEYSDFTLNCLNKEQFALISDESIKILLLKQMLNLIVNNNNKLAKRKLKKLLFDGNTISILLDDLISNHETNQFAKNAKRRRIVNEKNFSLENNEWKMFMITLESIQSKKYIINASILMKSLLNYLKLTFFIDVKSSLEYLRQLILQSITNIMKDDNITDINSIQMEPIIECLRESQQKETQRIALMLISSVSNKFKKDTLDYIMPIFTFIGTNLLHCDDQFTIQVISDIMESIIPSLLNGSKDLIINVFIDSLADIPAHRRLPLFSKLLAILGERTHLSIIILKLVDKTLNKSKIERQLYFNIAISLFSYCHINVQLESLNQIMNCFADYYIHQKQNNTNRKLKLTDSELRIISHNLLHVVFNVIDCQEFAQSIANTKWLDISKFLLNFLHTLIVINEKSNVLETELKDTNNYNKRIRYYLHQILLKLSSLLPNQQMLDLVIQLMKNDSCLIKRRALEMLKEKLENYSNDNFNENQLNKLIEILITQLPTVKTVNNLDDPTIYNTQLSMITLKLISKNIFKNESNREFLNRIIARLIDLIKAMKQQISVNFKASCILCLTQMMVLLSNNAIPLLPTVVPIILNNFIISDEVVVISYVTAISKLTQNFSQFLSSFLDKLIMKLFVVYSKYSQSIALKTKLKSIWLNMANITKSVLFSSLDSAYPHIYQLSIDCLYEFLQFTKLSIENVDKTDVDSILKYYRNLMLKALDYRNVNKNGLVADIDKIENCCIDSFCTLIPKMNEITFRPLFFKLNDWAVRENNGTCYQRMITFYKLSQFLVDKLKDLFCKFIAPLIVTNGCQMLVYFHGNNKKSVKSIEHTTGHKLICAILETLYKCFMYDINGEFLTKDRTQALIKPIVDQLTNTLGTDDDYTSRLELVCLCTQYLIHAKIDASLVKDINCQILLKTRETSSQVRCGALKALHRLIITSGEDYLSLVPEVVPVIAELSEDDSNEIESMVKLIVTDLEHIVGEPISKYF